MKRVHFASYEPFHYWINGYRHTNIRSLAAEWQLTAEQTESLVSSLSELEADIFGFWARCYESSDYNSPEYYLDAIVRELVDFGHAPASGYADIYPELAPIADDIDARLDEWRDDYTKHDDSDGEAVYLFDAGWGGGLEDSESLFYNYDFSYCDLVGYRGCLDACFQSYVIDKALDQYYDDIDYLDDDDPDDAEALREAFERCVQDIADSVPDHYGYTFAYELEDFEWPDDIRDQVMERVFGEDWRDK